MFVDGRYTLQAAKQVDAKAWHVEPLVDPPPESWLAKHLVAGDRLGFDPWLHTSAAAERLAGACARAGAELIAVDSNPLDSVWTERPPPPLGPVAIHGLQFSGEAEAEKLQADPARNRTPRRRSAGAVGFARGGLDLQHPRRRRVAYAAAAVLRAGAEGGPAHRVHRSPQTFQQRPRSSRTVRRCRGAGGADAKTHRAGESRRGDRARRRHRGRRAEPPDRGRRRQAGARQRSGQPAQGGQEPDRDRGHAHRAPARCGGADALPGLDRSRGADAARSPRSTPSRRWRRSAATPAR